MCSAQWCRSGSQMMWESKHFDRRMTDKLLQLLSVFAYILRIRDVLKMLPHLVSYSDSGRFPL
jgi:hypothetical protein